MSSIAPDFLETASGPIRQAVRHLRWFKPAFHAQVAAITRQTGIEFAIDPDQLVEVFLEWQRAFEAQKPGSQQARHDYVGFAAGLMLREMIKSRLLGIRFVPPGIDALKPVHFWPEGYVYVAFCLNVRRAVLDQDFGQGQPESPMIEDLKTWQSFRRQTEENASLAISFLDLFAGDAPDWEYPSVFGRETAATIKLPRYAAQKVVATLVVDNDRTEKGAITPWGREKRLPDGTRLVIFEFDGVVCNATALALDELCQIINEYGVAITLQETRHRFTGRPIAAAVTHVAEKTGRICPKRFAREWENRVTRRYRNELRMVPGAEALFDALQARGVEICLVSATSDRLFGAAMAVLGLSQRFKHRSFGNDCTEAGSPAPDLLLHAACEMGVLAQSSVVIAASQVAILAAGAGEMVAIGFSGGGGDRKTPGLQTGLQDAVFCLDEFSELSFGG